MNREAHGRSITEIVENNANERHDVILRFARGEINSIEMLDEIHSLDQKLEHEQLNWMADNNIIIGPPDELLQITPDEFFMFNWN